MAKKDSKKKIFMFEKSILFFDQEHINNFKENELAGKQIILSWFSAAFCWILRLLREYWDYNLAK